MCMWGPPLKGEPPEKTEVRIGGKGMRRKTQGTGGPGRETTDSHNGTEGRLHPHTPTPPHAWREHADHPLRPQDVPGAARKTPMALLSFPPQPWAEFCPQTRTITRHM